MRLAEILDAAIADYHAREHKEYGCPTCPVLVELEVYEAVAIRAALGGFTREMLVDLIDLISLQDPECIEGLIASAKGIAARIEPLLPPEPK